MTENWYLVKYVEDVLRNEPKNVGVVVAGPRGSAVQFIGQRHDGTIDGRRVRGHVAAVETYREWVNFVCREAEHGTLDERIERLGRRRYNYVIEERGPLLGDLSRAPLEDVVLKLYSELVERPHERQQSVAELAGRAIARLEVPPNAALEKEVTYEITLKDGVRREVTFDYRYTNGRQTLLDTIGLSHQSRTLAQRVNDLIFRIEHVDAEGISNFLVMYGPGGEPSTDVEQLVNLIDKYAYTVNVEEQYAAETIGDILDIPVREELLTVPLSSEDLRARGERRPVGLEHRKVLPRGGEKAHEPNDE